MLYFIITTGRCNLKCRYCGGSFPPELVPWEIQYDIKELNSFISQDPDAIIAFYGGEPLLNAKFIEKVMDNVQAKRFVIQTNGILFKKLKKNYWLRIDAVLLSIDGLEEITSYNRGKGVYRAVIKAAKYLREIGYHGDLIARMTITDRSDIYRDVKHLLSLNLFDHVHWQLNVIWCPRWNFKEWAYKIYLPGIRRLVGEWIESLIKGRPLGIVPFLGIAKRLLSKSNAIPPCGAGQSAFAILPNGRIIACPIAVDVKWAYLGHITTHSPQELPGRVIINDKCRLCKYYNVCGGRCLYTNKERYWGEEGFNEVCEVTIQTIDYIRQALEYVKDYINERELKGMLNYPPYNNTTEIIP